VGEDDALALVVEKGWHSLRFRPGDGRVWVVGRSSPSVCRGGIARFKEPGEPLRWTAGRNLDRAGSAVDGRRLLLAEDDSR